LAEINVTPLVDVMLVLLIVFMISAPLMQQGIQVDLPKTAATNLTEVPEQVTLVVNRSRQISLGGRTLAPGALRSQLEAMSTARPDIQVTVQADQSLPYGYVAQVMAEIRQAKIYRVGLVTEPSATGTHL
jgi:biopolymer transport protein TolR